MLVKICGVTTEEDAAYAARSGSGLVGIICTPLSKRCMDGKKAKEIASTIRENGAKPVLVFLDEEVAEMEELCRMTGAEYVQCHGGHSLKESVQLSPLIKRILVLLVDSDGTYVNEKEVFSRYKPKRDLILIDSNERGVPLNYSQISPPKVPFLVAGGITKENVKKVIKTLQPFGVDLSSSLEKEGSIAKDNNKIDQFMKEVL